MNLDCLFCILPYQDPTLPLLGPCILSGVLKKNNYKSKIIDFNIELFKQYDDDSWQSIEPDFLPTKKFNENIISFLNNAVIEIIKQNPKYVGFSIHSLYTLNAALYVSKELKKISDIKIIVGGGYSISKKNMFYKPESLNNFDYIIQGYGEEPILKILGGYKFDEKIILSHTPNFSIYSPPDFSDLNLHEYTEYGILPSYSSKGCFGNCIFCVVSYLWKNYVTRPIEHIINDLTFYKNTYNINTVKFQDSLINGKIDWLKELCNKLKPLNMRWYSLWRIRKNIPDEMYDLLKEAGCIRMVIGIESGSEKVRKKMNKPFTNETLFKTLDNFNRVGINILPLFITGYPDEEEEDFQQTLSLIDKFKEKNYTNIEQIVSQPLILDNKQSQLLNINNNYRERTNRSNRLIEHIIKNNIKLHALTYSRKQLFEKKEKYNV